ncbi:MAG: hypothetical protein DSY80_04665 [Desulfocapsa sp.]|nr:MAG: hypothetical protein DSY80_04665 [Desulfocapsa sp.]
MIAIAMKVDLIDISVLLLGVAVVFVSTCCFVSNILLFAPSASQMDRLEPEMQTPPGKIKKIECLSISPQLVSMETNLAAPGLRWIACGYGHLARQRMNSVDMITVLR